ncbi:hypothetical protein KFE25_000052 [Diacronema lutheri]|uniref:Uncharacterized protein n=1 Tax=Diacronema lutheri TaxID=2081491 RepID=A0A8J6C8S1_DIALT|nr:hypothetical protein KFE25_000052 [Diacronema lutheri]
MSRPLAEASGRMQHMLTQPMDERTEQEVARIVEQASAAIEREMHNGVSSAPIGAEEGDSAYENGDVGDAAAAAGAWPGVGATRGAALRGGERGDIAPVTLAPAPFRPRLALPPPRAAQ